MDSNEIAMVVFVDIERTFRNTLPKNFLFYDLIRTKYRNNSFF